jgi:hypothetical protein
VSFRGPLVERIATFLRDIGLSVEAADLPKTRLPGIEVRHGGLAIDEDRLTWPGDLLHEAGHLAVASPERRALLHQDVGDDLGEEIAATAWSWAAAQHLGIDPAIVFHEGGYGTKYKPGGAWIVENFARGNTFGVPLLQWLGMTFEKPRAAQAGVPPFPHMVRWLRER